MENRGPSEMGPTQRDPGRTWTLHSSTCHGPDPCFRARAVGQKPRQAERNSLVSEDALSLCLTRAKAPPLPTAMGSCRGSEEGCELAAHSKGGGRRSDSPSWVPPEITADQEVPDPKTSATHPSGCAAATTARRRMHGSARSRRLSPRAAQLTRRRPTASRQPRQARKRKRHIPRGITPIFMYKPGELDHLQPRSLDFPARRGTGAPPLLTSTGMEAKLPRCMGCRV